jgi:hypothetical protein
MTDPSPPAAVDHEPQLGCPRRDARPSRSRSRPGHPRASTGRWRRSIGVNRLGDVDHEDPFRPPTITTERHYIATASQWPSRRTDRRLCAPSRVNFNKADQFSRVAMSLGHPSDCLVRQRMDSSAVGFSAPPLEHAGQRPSLRHVPAAKSPDRSWPRVGDDIAPDCPDRARAASRRPVQIAKARDRQICVVATARIPNKRPSPLLVPNERGELDWYPTTDW